MTARFLDLTWVDVRGRPHVVRVPAERPDVATSAIEIRRDDVAPAAEGGTLRLRLDRDAVYESLWCTDVDVVMCDLVEGGGEASGLCARSALRRIVDELRSTVRATPVVAAEFEFYLYDAASGDPVYDELDAYGFLSGVAYDAFLQDLHALGDRGVPVQATNIEYAGGQFEVNLHHREALRAMDDAVVLRSAVCEAARRRGLTATFMAKPWSDRAGSGMHVHQSLWSDDGNVFASERALSSAGTSYLAGLLAGIVELAPLGSASANAYRRRQQGSFCPTNVSWGKDNRTVAVRVLTGDERATRLEQRDAAADCNPYLTVAGQLAAGLEGLLSVLGPPAPVLGNAYGAHLPSLPRSLEAAVPPFASSPLARRALGDELHATMVTLLDAELERSRVEVTEWERRLYLEGAPYA